MEGFWQLLAGCLTFLFDSLYCAQVFELNPVTKQLSDPLGKRCVEVTRTVTPLSPFTLILADCDVKPEQIWEVNAL